MRRFGFLLVLLLIVGCSAGKPAPIPAPASPTPASEPAPAPTPAVEPAPAPRADAHNLPRGAWVDGASAGPSYLNFDLLSPDMNWWADITGEQLSWHSLVVFDGNRKRAWVLEPEYWASNNGSFMWTERNTLIYYRELGPEQRDTWFEADPATGKVTPFLPSILSGNHAGHLSWSSDKKRLLVGTGYCSGCNKPSANDITTYLVDLTTGKATELGVDVQAEWDGDQVKVVAQAPNMGYSGPAFWDTLQRGGLPRPLYDSIQVGGTDYVEFRAYRLNAASGEPPLRVIPGHNEVDTYNRWELWWPDPPAEPFRLEAWAEVRATVPDPPPENPYGGQPDDIRWEGGKRWAVVFSREIAMLPEPARQTIQLQSIKMWDTQNGWGVGFGGRILRTADGGATWSDVSPSGMQRCTGRYRPRQTQSFTGNTATVAIACDRTGSDGKWTQESRRISIFRSTDGAATWQGSNIDSEYRFASPTSLQFIDQQVGFAVVQPLADLFVRLHTGTVYRTGDGGRTWEKVTDTGDGKLPSARAVTFLDARRAWAVGPEGRSLWGTEDGGRTWGQVPVDLTGYMKDSGWVYAGPRFVTGTEGYFVVGGFVEGAGLGRRELYWTSDDGHTWEKRSKWDGERAPTFLTPEIGYIWEYEARAVGWTHDGGRTWSPNPWDVNPTGIESVQFLDEQHGFAAQGLLWKTEDGGRNWAETYPQVEP